MSDAERDATERVEQAEAENARLRTRARFLESLFEHAPEALYVHDLDGRFLEVNAAACQATGRTRDALLAGHVADLGDEWTPQGVSAWAHALTPFRVEVRDRLARRGDRSVTTQTRVTRIDTDDRSCVLAAVRDLSEQRSAEARHRALVETTLMGVYLIQDNRFVYVNDKAEELLGHSRTELLEMPSFLDVIADEDKASIEALRDERIAGNIGPFTYTMRVRRKDGTVVHLDVHSIATDYQDRLAVLGTINDVTAQKALEAQVLQSRQRLRNLAARLHAVREEERSTISRENPRRARTIAHRSEDRPVLVERAPARTVGAAAKARTVDARAPRRDDRAGPQHVVASAAGATRRPRSRCRRRVARARLWLAHRVCVRSVDTRHPAPNRRHTSHRGVPGPPGSVDQRGEPGRARTRLVVRRLSRLSSAMLMALIHSAWSSATRGRRTVGASPWRPGGRCAPEPRTQPIAPLFDLGSFLR